MGILFLKQFNKLMQEERRSITMELLEVEPPEEQYLSYEAYRQVILNLCLTGAFVGYSYTYFNSIPFEEFAKHMGITENLVFYEGFLSFLMPIGAALGALVSQYILEYFSRKNSFIFVGICTIISTLGLQIPFMPFFVLCRVLQGSAAGVYYVILSVYIKEFPPINLVGRFGPLMQVCFISGMVYTYAQVYIFSFFMDVSTYWRIVFIMPIIILGANIYNIIYKYPYETPKYLVFKGRYEEARQLLRKFLKPQYIEKRIRELKQYCDLLKQHPVVAEEEVRRSGISQDRDRIQKIRMQEDELQMTHNKKKSNPLPIIAAYHLSILQQMTAIQVIYIYVGQIVYKVYPSMASFLPILIHGEGIIAIFFTIYIINFLGRKTILQLGTMGICACLFILSFSFYAIKDSPEGGDGVASFLIVLALFGLRAFFSFSFAPIHPMYLAEVVEPKHVANGSLLMFMFQGSISFAFPVLEHYFNGPAPVFLIFALYTLAAFFANNYILVETKDKTEVEIHEEFAQKYEKIMGKLGKTS